MAWRRLADDRDGGPVIRLDNALSRLHCFDMLVGEVASGDDVGGQFVDDIELNCLDSGAELND